MLNIGRDLVILFIAGGGVALVAYFSERRRWAEHGRRLELERIGLQKSEADARLTLLQAQVEPHFLFNTLASVRSLIATDPARAARTVDALAEYLRATLPRLRAETGSTRSTLAGQFAICASYLELMKVRLGDRLRFELCLPEDLREADFPPLLLISLVENSIKHGVEPKPGTTRVTLTARRVFGNPDLLEVNVEDDGAGLELGMGEGTGLANVRSQLLMRFGSAATFDIAQRAGGGVIAQIKVPLELRA
jgi:sensor histidine kinase YesM